MMIIVVVLAGKPHFVMYSDGGANHDYTYK